jgi:hypothetical protein
MESNYEHYNLRMMLKQLVQPPIRSSGVLRNIYIII